MRALTAFQQNSSDVIMFYALFVLISCLITLTLFLLRSPHPLFDTTTKRGRKKQEHAFTLPEWYMHETNITLSTVSLFPKRISEDIFLLVCISSHPAHIDLRQAIRETWGISNEKVRFVFFMGKSGNQFIDLLVQREHQQYGDIFQADYEEDYRAITTKVVAMLVWATSLSSKFILKSDDDMWVNINRLVHTLSISDISYGGFVIGGRVNRNPDHRHYTDPLFYPFPKWVPYCKGGAYVFSSNLLQPILNAANHVPYLTADDAYVGLLMDKVGVRPKTIPGFQFMKFFPYYYQLPIWDRCYFESLTSIGDGLDEGQIRSIHNTMTDKNSMCFPSCIYTNAIPFTFAFVLSTFFLIKVFSRRHNDVESQKSRKRSAKIVSSKST